MADHAVSEVISAESILSDKKENVSECCKIIKLEVNEMKLVLSSCKEIISVLLEEKCKVSPPTASFEQSEWRSQWQ
jgi:hypothetical protein